MTHSVSPPCCSALCLLPSGEEINALVSDLSLGGAFVVCMIPPPLGSRVTLTVRPKGGDPVDPIAGRVTRTRLDPSSAMMSGFELLFEDLPDGVFDDLAAVVAALGSIDTPSTRRIRMPHQERREHPRVSINLHAYVTSLTGKLVLAVHNISMTGALLVIADDASRDGLVLEPPTQIELTIAGTSTIECIDLRAVVVRKAIPPEPEGVGIRFLSMGEDEARRLEGLMLHALALEASQV